MSAAVVEPPVAALPPVEHARRLGAKDRAALLAELLRDQPTGALHDPTGVKLGYCLPCRRTNRGWN